MECPKGFEIVHVPVSKLKDHERQAEYCSEVEPEFIERIRDSGVMNPIHISEDFVVLSGWRRKEACVKSGKKTIPAIVRKDAKSAAQQLLIWAEGNDYRDETPLQKTLRFVALIDAQGEIAKESQRTKQKSELKNNRSRDEAASIAGLGSGRTAQKAAKAVETANRLRESGREAEANEVVSTLNTKSVSAAHKMAREFEESEKPEKPARSGSVRNAVAGKPFDEKMIDRAVGPVARALGERAKHCKGGTRNEGYSRVQDQLDALLKEIHAWRKSDPL